MDMTLLAAWSRATAYVYISQLGPMIVALLVCRFWLKSRGDIWAISAAGVVAAMLAYMMVDGQAACCFLIYVPVIYCLAVVGREGLR